MPAIIASFIISFQKYDVITPAIWCGLENYRWIFSSIIFWRGGQHSALCCRLYSPEHHRVAALSSARQPESKGYWHIRTVFYLPVVTSMVAVSLVFSWLFNPYYGLINHLLSLLGIQASLVEQLGVGYATDRRS